ncbi:esterase [Mycobacterium phage Sheen]|uniref:Esterase n=1 Tax=Mycobacterium phage Sheen TaxID=1589274 RepID=A0A0B5A484_9CAUD|nr:esterase/lipase [Mycobacterium phage Sheen]AJD82480.1 esterase [Mycobacterium phage Sheen]
MTLRNKGMLTRNGFLSWITTAGDKDGSPLVLLHGLSVSAKAYEELIEDLAGRGFYVIAPDAPNHGGSGSLPWGHTIGDMADILADTLAILDIEQAVIVGHSMGGGLAVEFAARYPQMVTAAVLMDAAAGKEHHDGVSVKPGFTIPTRAVRIALGSIVDVLGDGYAAMASRTNEQRLSLLSTLKESVRGFRFIRTAEALMRADTEPLLEKMAANRVPTAVIHGEWDQIIPLDAGISTAAAALATLYIVKGGFHSWMLADPELAADLIVHAVVGLSS